MRFTVGKKIGAGFSIVVFLLLIGFNAYGNEKECLAENVYFEARGQGQAGWVAVAQVTLNRVQDKRFPNTTLSECAQKCLDNNPQCISFEYKKKDGNDNNVCHLTNDCHRYYYTNDNNSDVFMKNNVKVNENVNYPPPTCSQTNETDYYNRWIHFFWKKKQNHRKWSYPINSKPGTKYHLDWVGSWPNDDWGSIEIPPRTELIIYEHSRYRGNSKKYTNNDYVNYQKIVNLHGWRDHITSFKARSL